MRVTWTRLLVVGLCLALCAGVIWGKKRAAGTIDRNDIMDRIASSRDNAMLIAAANLRFEHAKNLIASGQNDAAVDVLNQLTRMELPDTEVARKVMSDAYLLLADGYRDFPAKASELRKLAENPMAYAEDAGDDVCEDAVHVALPHSEVMSIDPAYDHNWRSFDLTAPTLVQLATDGPSGDTVLELYDGCPGTQVAYNDDGGPGLFSLIEICLAPGTYYAKVRGFGSSTPSDFTFDITELDTCVIPEPDEYEPDNEASGATVIGFRNNGVGGGNQTGRDNKAVQQHSIYPAGDIDFVYFELSRANRVWMTTWSDANDDTIIGMSNSGGQLLAVNDDAAPGFYGSQLNFCLPPGDPWYLAILGYFSNDEFEYNVAVDVEFPCNFEEEPNGVCDLANDMEPGVIYSGLQTAAGVAENDYWTFTLEEEAYVVIETGGWDIYNVDTYLELYDGCPGTLLAGDDDAGPGYLSKIEGLLGPGTYYVNATVSSWSVGSNYPYDILLTFSEPPLMEVEPNDTCDTANPVFLGDSVLASISPVGDRDNFLLSVPADTFVEIGTDGPSGDTAVQIDNADGSVAIGCDDDSGPSLWSLWGCCLPAGDYCVEVKDYGDNSVISTYNIWFSDLGSCTATDPLVCPVAGLSCPF